MFNQSESFTQSISQPVSQIHTREICHRNSVYSASPLPGYTATVYLES